MLPIALLIIIVPLSWMPSARMTGWVFGLIVIYKLPYWLNFLPFLIFFVFFMLMISWLVAYPIMYWINYSNTNK
jgi:hypothetical protein